MFSIHLKLLIDKNMLHEVSAAGAVAAELLESKFLIHYKVLY